MGNLNYGTTLNELVRGFELVDMWAPAPERGRRLLVWTGYTYRANSVERNVGQKR